MRNCSYCGKQYPDDAVVCAIDQQPLLDAGELQSRVAPPRVACPECGAADDFTPAIDLRGSFSLPAFFFGGLVGVLLWNLGKSRPVRCNSCQARFYFFSLLSKISRVTFWLLVLASIIPLLGAVIGIIRGVFVY
jgi:DNA-directed RNA polymerase subunit RPC12/RpoP